MKTAHQGIAMNCRDIKKLTEQLLELNQSSDKEKALIMLEGTEYSQYAIPLDYMPSRNLQPRWGYSTGPMPKIVDWFASYHKEYYEMLSYMRSLSVNHISKQFVGNGKPSWTGGCVCPFDLLALYAMIRKHRPKHYIEIGSGMTTCFARQAVIDGKLDTKIISIDPSPRMEIEDICDEVFKDGLENFDLSKLDVLEPNDILFFDGSHRVFMNSDVTVFFIDILPRLNRGVIIHLHDIDIPYDYPHIFTNWYWSEQYMLAVAFLNGMDKITPLFPTRYIAMEPTFSKQLNKPFVDLGEENTTWHDGGSMWFMYK